MGTFIFNSIYLSRHSFLNAHPQPSTSQNFFHSLPQSGLSRPAGDVSDAVSESQVSTSFASLAAMPSRKKKQGRARKTKQAEIRSINPSHNSHSSNCDHLDPDRNWLQRDFVAANNLRIEFESKHNAFFADRLCTAAFVPSILALIEFVYDRYFQFSDGAKEIFKQLMLADGTKRCINEAKQYDMNILKETTMPSVFYFAHMMQTIEVRDSYGGALSESIMGEIQMLASDTVSSRETIRFFHRRNSCDCLKELYYKLKESTSRTSLCYNCFDSVDIRKMSQCGQCKLANYCSYACAVAHYPQHKEMCKKWKTNNSGSSDGTNKSD
eukprot:scaffold80797_cov43-Cyclotella_meneghiniana.AAC.3